MSASRLNQPVVEFIGQLASDTAIDEIAFADWLRDNRLTLRDEFCQSDEPDDFPKVENCMSIWLRRRFRESLKPQAQQIPVVYPPPNSRPAVSSLPKSGLHSPQAINSSPAPPAGIFSRLFRRATR